MKYTRLVLLLIVIFVCFPLTTTIAKRWNSSNNVPTTNENIDVIHYTIHLDVLDFTSKVIHGITHIDFEALMDDVATVNLELRQLAVDSIKFNNQLISTYNHTGDNLTVMLPESMNQGQSALISVYYHGVPFSESWGGFHFSGQYAFNLGVGFVSYPPSLGKTWFACVDDFRDRATFDFHIRVSDDKKAICGGLLQSVTQHGDNTHTFHWQMTRSIPTYLASVAVGQYELWQDTYNGIQEDIPIMIYARPSDVWKVPGSFSNLKNILTIFENHFGPYPFERVGYVSTALGAMEHAGNIAYPHSSIDNTTNNEWLYTHELSHMWFGDNVTCDGAPEMWLNEGWAVWTEIFYREMLYGFGPSRIALRQKQKEVLQFAHTPSGDGAYYALYNIPPALTYGSTVYQKGGMVVHTLQHYLGNDVFFPAVQAYLDTFAFSHASSYDLRDFMSQYTGTEMTDFFDNWVFAPGFPHYSIDSFNIIQDIGAEVFVRQRSQGRTFLGNSNIVEISFMNQSRQIYSDTMMFDGQTGSKVFALPFEPVLAMMDYYEKTCDATTDFYHLITTTGTRDFTHTFSKAEVLSNSDTTFLRIIHNWVAPDSLKTALPGITLSPYRHWLVEGIIAQGFYAKGHFQYTRSGYLDNTLITNQLDSLLILWRPSTKADWQRIPFTKVGPWSIGWIIVDTLKAGEYTLAVKDHLVGIQQHDDPGSGLLKVYPNPGSGMIWFEWKINDIKSLQVHQGDGKLVDTLVVNDEKQATQYNTQHLNPGIYWVSLVTSQNKNIHSQKFVVSVP